MRYHHLRLLPRAIILLLIAGSSLRAQPPATSSWQLAYSVDSLGNRTAGDKAALIAAVRSGQPVRVGWAITWRLPDGTAGGVEHAAEAAFLSIHHGEVFAQLRPILGQAPAAREAIITLRTDPERLWYALLDTTGRLQGYFTGSGGPPQVTRAATSWYVPRPADASTGRP